MQAISGIDLNRSSIDKQRYFSTSCSLLKPVFCSTADEAVKDIPSGSKLLVGGRLTEMVILTKRCFHVYQMCSYFLYFHYSSFVDLKIRILIAHCIFKSGFGLCGIPENLIGALLRSKTDQLTVVSNNAGEEKANDIYFYCMSVEFYNYFCLNLITYVHILTCFTYRG